MRYRILPSDNSTAGVKFVEHFTFKIGHTVPLYEVSSVAALNQLIGYAKYINKDYGNVYYRGVKGLFDSISPSIMRNRQSGEAYDLKQLLTNVSNHQYLRKTLKLIKTIRPINEDDHVYNALVTRTNRNVIEAMLQHYAGYTRFIDVVNNHWIALWMGLHEFRICGEGRSFIACHKRTLDTGDIINFINSGKNNPDWLTDNLYEYIILIAMPHFKCTPIMGVYESSNLVEVDLRKALPSFFVRPHAQHALAISNGICILRRKVPSLYQGKAQCGKRFKFLGLGHRDHKSIARVSDI